MFGRLKDFRRVATRYDKLARNFLATIAIAAAILWWLKRQCLLRVNLSPDFVQIKGPNGSKGVKKAAASTDV